MEIKNGSWLHRETRESRINPAGKEIQMLALNVKKIPNRRPVWCRKIIEKRTRRQISLCYATHGWTATWRILGERIRSSSKTPSCRNGPPLGSGQAVQRYIVRPWWKMDEGECEVLSSFIFRIMTWCLWRRRPRQPSRPAALQVSAQNSSFAQLQTNARRWIFMYAACDTMIKCRITHAR